MTDIYDIIIIGGGSAGVSAALTALNRGKAVAVVSNPVESTSLYKAELVTNYPGLEDRSGAELAAIFAKQLENSEAHIIKGRALSVISFGETFGVAVGPDYYQCRALIIAAGITREKLYPGESEFLGRGVSYCATCDGMLYRGKTVALIGSSEEAEQDVGFLEGIGCNVLRFPDRGRYEIKGGLKADTLIADGVEYRTDCIFIIKNTVSVTKLVDGIEYREGGIVTDSRMATAVPGVFAAGDCTGRPYQLPRAVGQGNIAALSACEYIDRHNQ